MTRYELLYDNGTEEYLVIFREWGESTWLTRSRHEDKEDALLIIKALNDLERENEENNADQ